MKEPIKFLYELNNLGLVLWNENGKLKYKQYRELVEKEALFNIIKENKELLLDILLQSGVTHGEVELPLIYRTSSNQVEQSFAQGRLWFIEQYEQGTHAYHLPIVLQLSEEMNQAHFKLALQAIVNRHEVLRTTFMQDEKGLAYQIVLDDSLSFIQHEYKNKQQFDDQLQVDIRAPFNLIKTYPIRVCFYNYLDEQGHVNNLKNYVLINIHHIAFDGWSADIFLKELIAYYEHISQGKTLQLPTLAIQYKDFSTWQRHYLSGEKLEKQVNYWKKQLENFESLSMPTDKIRPAQIDYSGNTINFELDVELSSQLNALAKSQGCTLYTILLSGFYILLNKYTGQSDLVVGTPMASRDYAQLENLIGFFVNSLVMRARIESEDTGLNLIKKVQETLMEGQRYQELPFEKLVELLHIQQDLSRHPIFQIMFGVQDFQWELTSDYFKPFKHHDTKIARFDLELLIRNQAGKITGEINYATSLFKEETIIRLLTHYKLILNQLANEKGKKIKEYVVLTNEELKRIVCDWNKTEKTLTNNKTIHELFQDQVEKKPDHVALIFENESLTYKELNEKSNQLAHYIRKQYQIKTSKVFQSNTLIALCLDRSFDMVIGILGVLKAGGAYVPIDSAYPDERIRYLLDDTQSSILLTQKNIKEKLQPILKEQCVITLDEKFYQNENIKNDNLYKEITDLAYVIYTSGSTGKPKGVLITHKNVHNYLAWHEAYSQVSANDRVDCSSSIAFDLTVTVILGPLLRGACIVLCSNDVKKDPNLYYQHLLEHKVNVLKLTPSYCAALTMNLSEEKPLLPNKQLILGGEALDLTTVKKWLEFNPNDIIYNEYGPTEATVGVSQLTMTKASVESLQCMSIGKPAYNTQLYILDSNRQPVPQGVVGELYIGGEGLARGYLNRPELTEERFVNNPFSSIEDKEKGYTKLYKTGDLVRWLPDGNIEYIDRNDFQVKIRGFRIELGEIEHALLNYESISQVCILIKERNSSDASDQITQKYLVAYYVSNSVYKQETLVAHLSSLLPDYMIPNVFVHMSDFPLTVNGKLDREALPDPETVHDDKNETVLPTSELEHELCEIWKSVLSLDEINLDDNFFSVGGDSILSTQLSARLRKAGHEVSVRDVFNYHTVKRLAAYLSSKREVIEIGAEQEILNGNFNLLPIQSWFFERIKTKQFQAYEHWNQSFLIKVPQLDLKQLEATIKKLVMHHDALRLRYPHWQQKIQQSYLKVIEIPSICVLDVSNLSDLTIQETLTQWQSDFNLAQGPLWKVGYLHGYQDGTARVYFALHHLIVDTVSWRILIEDIKTVYEGKALEKKSSSYRQWAETVDTYVKTHGEESAFWENQIQGLPDYNKYFPQETSSSVQSFELEKKLTEYLLQEANAAYHTQINDLLLTALGYALKNWMGGTIQGITLEGHGRELLDETVDVSRTVGWFTTIYPVKLELGENLNVSIKQIKEGLRKIPNKGIGYSALYYQSESPLTRNALPIIRFNYLGQFDTQDGFWQVIPESSGVSMHNDNMNDTLINISGMVIAGKLQFHIVTQLEKETSQAVTEDFKTNLILVIEHCIKKIQEKDTEYTPSDFETVNISQALLENLHQSEKILGTTIEAIYPANSLQQGFIYHALSQVGDEAYRVQDFFEYHNPLNIESYKRAWELVIKTYPILRASFNWEEELIQLIHSEGRLNFKYYDLSTQSLSKAEMQIEVDKIQKEDRQKSFNLTEPTQLRLYLIKHSEAEYTLLKSEHHIISDGWSAPILLKKVHDIYKQLELGALVQIQEEKTYLKVQEYYQEHKEEMKSYWDEQIKKIECVNDLSVFLKTKLDLNEVKVIESPQKEELKVTGQLYQSIKKIVKNESITINTFIQFAWHKLIQSYTQDRQTIVGTTISGRNISVDGIEESVGLYINTLPLLINWSNQKETTIAEQLKYIHQQIIDLTNYSYPYLAELQNKGERLFHSLFVFENYPLTEELRGIEGDSKICIEFKEEIHKLDYPFGIVVFDRDGILTIRFEYAGEYIEKEKVKKLSNQLYSILEKMLVITNKVSDINLLTTDEYNRLLYTYNQTDKIYPHGKTLNQIFEEQAEKKPNEIAIVYNGKNITYKQLNEQSNQFARYLIEQYSQEEALQADSLIALFMNRSDDMLVAMLGILKAGGAYVPIDLAYPEERISYILSDTNAKMIITQSDISSRLDPVISSKTQVIIIDEEKIKQDIEKLNKDNLFSISQEKNLAYVIYTSGTTGKPKGVMIEHKSVINYIYDIQNNIIKHSTRICFSTSIAFDLSLTSTLGGLLTGKTIVIYAGDVQDIESYVTCLNKNKVDTVKLTPSYSEQLFLHHKAPSLKVLIVGGEKLTDAQISLFEQAKIEYLFDEYGPTETTVGVTVASISENSHKGIGSPISNIRLYVLDDNLNPVPECVTGELYIGGAGLARGYLNQVALTNEKFIFNPFATDQDKSKGYTRLYKTGDLVKWLPEGNLEYIGRADFQVKIRGYRVELNEIESSIAQFEGIEKVVVTTKERRTDAEAIKYLVAYYDITKEKIKDKNTKEIDNDLVQDWNNLYENIYQDNNKLEINTFDISGWLSSYTGQLISTEEMSEWVNCTVDRICNLNPKNIVEIGCGAGLLMYPLSTKCNNYLGLDFSSAVIKKLQKTLAPLALNNVELYAAKADELLTTPLIKNFNDKIDTVILNSIIQYFPSMEYFENVLTQSLSFIDLGKIFIGDVRDYRMHEEFHYSVELYKTFSYSTDFDVKKFNLSLQNKIKQEKELLISPEYFLALFKKHKKIKYVELLPKRGRGENEMNRFRYDVILHIDNRNEEPLSSIKHNLNWTLWNEEKTNLTELLRKEYEYIAIKGYPNKRVFVDYHAKKHIENNDGDLFNKQESLKFEAEKIFSLEDLHQLAEENDFQIYTCLSLGQHESKRTYDVVFYKNKKIDPLTIFSNDYLYSLYDEYINHYPSIKLYNHPVVNFKKWNIDQQKLRKFLSAKLPDYMIPSVFVELKKFPINNNGKLDHKALPDPEFADQDNYLAPENDIENALCLLWQEILGVERIGMNDDFFRLGGNSIVAIRISHKMSQILNKPVTISHLFKYKNLKTILLNKEEENNLSYLEF